MNIVMLFFDYNMSIQFKRQRSKAYNPELEPHRLRKRVFRNKWCHNHGEECHSEVGERASTTGIASVSLTLIAA